MLMSHAPRLTCASASRFDEQPRFSGQRGRQYDDIARRQQLRRGARTEARRRRRAAASRRRACGLRSRACRRPDARRATSVPIDPRPTMPSCLPWSVRIVPAVSISSSAQRALGLALEDERQLTGEGERHQHHVLGDGARPHAAGAGQDDRHLPASSLESMCATPAAGACTHRRRVSDGDEVFVEDALRRRRRIRRAPAAASRDPRLRERCAAESRAGAPRRSGAAGSRPRTG